MATKTKGTAARAKSKTDAKEPAKAKAPSGKASAKAKAKTTAAGSKKRKRVRKKVVDNRETVLVTGAAGGLGRLLCRKLHRHFKVIGVDRRPFTERPKDVEHHRIDLRRKSALQLIRKKKPDCIIHLGVIHNPHSDEAFNFNLRGTAQLLRVAERLKVRKFLYLSSANLYGPSATSSGFLTEEAPLLAAASSPEVRDLISLDMMVQSFFWKQPDTETVILRPVHIVGPHLRNAPSKYFRLPRVPTILGFDPMVQLVHESDLVEALLLGLEPGNRGVFNITGQASAPISRLVKARNGTTWPIPGPLFKSVLDRMFRYHITRFPSAELDHLRYSCVVDGLRARKLLGYQPKRSLQDTIMDID